MLFRRLVVLNTAVLVLLVAAMVCFNIEITDELVENEIYGTFENAMDSGADDLSQVFGQARDLALELCVLGSVQETLYEGFAGGAEPVDVIMRARTLCRGVVRLVSYCDTDVLLSDGQGGLLALTADSGGVVDVSQTMPAWCGALLESEGGFLWDYYYNDFGSYVRVSRLIYN